MAGSLRSRAAISLFVRAWSRQSRRIRNRSGEAIARASSGVAGRRGLPKPSIVLLKAMARAVDAPPWRVMVEALHAYMGEGPILSEEQRRATRGLMRLRP